MKNMPVKERPDNVDASMVIIAALVGLIVGAAFVVFAL